MFKYLFCLSILHTVFTDDNYFCNFTCKSDHTVCRRQPCSVSPACGPGAKPLPLDDNNRAWVLDLHNQLRNKIALGQDTRGGNSQAANMRALSYDEEIEYVAQCWSNACRETGKAHDVCRSTKKFEGVGQNMFAMGYTAQQDFKDNKWLTVAVNSWYDEISKTTPLAIDNHPDDDAIGHFTQVVWATTTHIGCGRTFYKSGKYYSVYIYCNYATSGNVLGNANYIRGAPCSQCGKDSCNEKYPGLCGKINPIQKWSPTFKKSASNNQRPSYMFLILILVLYCV